MKKVFTFFYFFIGILSVTAQNGIPCHSDEMHHQLVQSRPDLLPVLEQKRQELELYTKNFAPFPSKSGPYIIPVVFHVMHLNGPENIAEEQIHDALKHLNEQFNKRNADTSQTINAFKGIAADVQIEFRLAKKDPNGVCSNGITRHYSTTTIAGNHDVKSVVHWPPNQYLNIYVCQDAAGLAGHSLMPIVADTLPNWDGIVMRHDYVGAIGTSQWLHRTVLTHEVGHYLNLYHIWGGNNVPGFYYLPVANAGNCAYDDEVTDTPNTIGWQTCNINGSSCSSLDNVQNYMDYSYCSTMFTEGQKQRMHAVLNSSIANRNNLWNPTNLAATGVLNDGELCFSDFEIKRPYACIGDTVDIFDRSYHHVVSRVWQIPNGTIISQQDSIVRVVFHQEGVQSIQLTVSDGVDTAMAIKDEAITILPSVTSNDYLWESFEYPENTNRTVLLNSSNYWQFTDKAASGNNGYYINNYQNNTSSYSFDLRPINLTNITNPSVIFDRAYANIDSAPFESLEIKVSTNCGVSWNTIRSFTPASLSTVPTIANGPYVPASNEWATVSSFSIPASYRKAHTMLRFSYNGKGYNNLYLDNINVGSQDKLHTSLNTTSIFSIYPNPAQSEFTIQSSQEIAYSVELYDITGKNIASYNVPSTSQKTISLGALSTGIYLVKIYSEQAEKIERLVIE